MAATIGLDRGRVGRGRMQLLGAPRAATPLNTPNSKKLIARCFRSAFATLPHECASATVPHNTIVPSSGMA